MNNYRRNEKLYNFISKISEAKRKIADPEG
jgi:hypothetical protein